MDTCNYCIAKLFLRLEIVKNMSKLAFVIPSAIAVIAVVFVIAVFGNLLPQKNTDFTLGDLIERGSPHIGTSSDRKSTRLNSSHSQQSRMPSSA